MHHTRRLRANILTQRKHHKKEEILRHCQRMTSSGRQASKRQSLGGLAGVVRRMRSTVRSMTSCCTSRHQQGAAGKSMAAAAAMEQLAPAAPLSHDRDDSELVTGSTRWVSSALVTVKTRQGHREMNNEIDHNTLTDVLCEIHYTDTEHEQEVMFNNECH